MKKLFVLIFCFISLHSVEAQVFFSGWYSVENTVIKDGEKQKSLFYKVFTDGANTKTEYSGKFELFLSDSIAKYHIYPNDDTLWIENVERKYPSAIRTDLLPDKWVLGKLCKGIRITLDGGVIEAWFDPSVIMKPDYYSKQTAGGVKTIYTLTNGAIPLYLSLTTGDIVQIFEVKEIQPSATQLSWFYLPDKTVKFIIPQKP